MGARRIRAALLAAGLSLTGVAAVATAPTAAAVDAPAYELVDLGRTTGFMAMAPVGVDDDGLITGSACCPGPNGGAYQAFVAGPGLPLVKLASTFTSWSNGHDVLDGRVIGSADFGGEAHAFSWTAATGLVDLGVPGSRSTARAQNAAGLIVGSAGAPGAWQESPAVWIDGVQQIITSDPGAAVAVSAAGHVVGTAGSYPNEYAFTWTAEEGFRAITLIPGARSTATDVNASGVVVGTVEIERRNRGWVWSAQDGLTLFPNPDTVLTKISDSGIAIGTSPNGAVTWTKDGGVQQLLHNGNRWLSAIDVNAAGQVLGNGFTSVGVRSLVRSADGTTAELPLPEGASSVSPGAISPNGTVGGLVYGASGSFYAVWTLPVTDSDGDGVDDDADTCVDVANADQADLDVDGLGDACDDDIDGDGELNGTDALPNDPTETRDLDGDGAGDNSDPDVDGDGVANGSDAFPRDAAESADLDGDGTGDNGDPDVDGDGVANGSDAFPRDAAESADLDGDGTGDNGDPDVDGDGVANGSDAFPRNGAESADLDGDGTGNNADTDDDGDGTPDTSDAFPGDATRDGDEDDNGVADTPLPTSKDQCAGDGWKGFDNPSFKNAGQCAAKVASKGRK